MRDNTDNYRDVFLQQRPLIDVRAPVEFIKGAFAQAVNLPLMSDEERHQVGICYKQHGQDAAIALGHQLVSGQAKEARIAAWRAFAAANPEGYLYCFRGGLRSQIVQQWLADTGIHYPRVIGGYKALRRFLVDTLENAANECSLHIVAGLTGSGKTEVLGALSNSLDLEGQAHHRGSSFGGHVTPQPAQIDFENRLAIDVLRLRDQGARSLVLEDEGRMVGRCSVPFALFQKLQSAPLVWLEDSLDNRVTRILNDYVIDMHKEHQVASSMDLEHAFNEFAHYLLAGLQRVSKRLGPERYRLLDGLMREALKIQRDSGEVVAHRAWIERLLLNYYDPMYAYQRDAKEERIVFRGDREAIVSYLQTQS